MSQSASNFKADIDVHIAYEDQLQINKFARKNALCEEIKAQLIAKQGNLKDLDDAALELEELVAFDDAESIAHQIGEVFVYKPVSESADRLQQLKRNVSDDISKLNGAIEALQTEMSTLKEALYKKFGNHINLEAE